MKPVVTINTYAGSLLVGAKMAGATVERSLEDSGYGVAQQRQNFPSVPVTPYLPWPRLDLRGRVVIAHPPCAAFSTMNTHREDYGTRSPHFEETRRVMEYALSHGCDSLAVESVIETAYGAAKEHDATAARHGYNVFRLFVDSADFGVPMKRDRFWCVFSKTPRLLLRWEPKRVSVGEVMEGEGQLQARHQGLVQKQAERLRVHGLDAKRVMGGGCGFGTLHSLLKRYPIPHMSRDAAIRKYGLFSFDVANFKLLNPGGFAQVFLGSSWFCVPHEGQYGCRSLTLREYCLLMGFPPGYRLPERDHLTFLSRGVCPPVAAWVVRQLCDPPTSGVPVEPGGHCDLIGRV